MIILVRRFSSTDLKKSPDPSKLKFAPEWVPPPVVLSSQPGMHRFVWDLRYPSAEPATAERPSPQGAWAPPGRYEIELNVAGKKFRQPLEVKEDPRVTISQAALLREFTLTQQIEQASARVSSALEQATRLLDALESRLAESTAPHEDMVQAEGEGFERFGCSAALGNAQHPTAAHRQLAIPRSRSRQARRGCRRRRCRPGAGCAGFLCDTLAHADRHTLRLADTPESRPGGTQCPAQSSGRAAHHAVICRR